MSSHIVAPRPRAVTSERLAQLDAIICTATALCRRPGVDPDDWFPLAASEADYQAIARNQCNGCLLISECLERQLLLENGLAVWETDGIAAGTTPLDRYAMRCNRAATSEAVA